MNKKYNDGIDYRFLHFRSFSGMDAINLDSRGGATYAYVVLDDGKIRYAKAICSNKDNFCRKAGRGIAITRLNSDGRSYLFTGTESDFITFAADKQLQHGLVRHKQQRRNKAAQ